MLVIFLAAVFWPRANGTGAFVTLVLGVITGIVGFAAIEVAGLLDIHFLYANGLLNAFAVVVLVIASLATEPPDAATARDMTWSPRLWTEESSRLKGVPLWQNYRVLSVVLLLTTAIIVYIYR